MATTSNERADEVDDLFDYDVDFGDVDFTIPDPEPLPPLPSATRRKGDDLGLDEEVQVKKKRVTVKLDEQRYDTSNHLTRHRMKRRAD
jgi:replication fork protection complex subunit Csm3/Swi3